MSIRLNNLLVGSHSLGNLGVLQEISLSLGDHGLAFVESFSLDLPLGFQSSHDVLVLPPDLGEKIECNQINRSRKLVL